MKAYLQRLAEKESLTQQEMEEAMEYLFSDESSDSQIAAFLMGLKSKGETIEEIVGLVKVMRQKALPFNLKVANVMDNCGTGGDGLKTFNISTTCAFVLAAAGIPVAKHGNRSVSSRTGSADVLEYLGVNLNLPPEASEELIAEINIAFLFAPHVHPKTKRIVKIRKELGFPTIFNLIGPLTNPVDLEHQLMGTYQRQSLQMLAEVLKNLGRKRAMVVNGAGSMDEASLAGENHVAILEKGEIRQEVIHPHDVGLPVYENEAVRGGDAKENAEILLKVLKGERGPHRDIVLLNSALGLFTGGKAATVSEGVKMAAEIIDSGAALEKLHALVARSQKMARGVS